MSLLSFLQQKNIVILVSYSSYDGVFGPSQSPYGDGVRALRNCRAAPWVAGHRAFYVAILGRRDSPGAVWNAINNNCIEYTLDKNAVLNNVLTSAYKQAYEPSCKGVLPLLLHCMKRADPGRGFFVSM